MKELYRIESDEFDDLNYLSIVNRILSACTFTMNYETVRITKIRNWFDHKWLNYSGKEVVHFESGFLVNNNLALDPKWKEQVTIPPFNPNRVIYSKLYSMGRMIIDDSEPIHKNQISGSNLQNKVTLNHTNQILAWFSSHTRINDKGSLMVYELLNRSVTTWYCQIEYRGEWKISKSKNIARERLIEMMSDE